MLGAVSELPLDRHDVDALLRAVWDADWKLDKVLEYLLEEDGGEEEDDSDS